MKIQILTDNKKSWFIPFGHILKKKIADQNHEVTYIFDKSDLTHGDICFLLSCSRIIENNYLKLNTHNIVVHASDLPQGKGFAPLQWQILAGASEITLTLFEVVEKVDAGPYYLKEVLQFNGTELYDELREKLAQKIIDMCLNFIDNQKKLKLIPQNGNESYYKKRTVKDDQIDPLKSIAEQFDHFRIADNDNYPLWFMHRGRKYFLKIYAE